MPPSVGGGEIMRLDGFTPQTPLDIVTGDGGVSLSVAVAKQWLCPQAPDHEVLRLLLTCKKEGLDPFRREAELVCYGGKWEVVIGKAGHLTKAQRHPAYDGFQAGIIVRPWDAKTKTFTGPPREIEGAFLPPDHLLVGGWCKVYRKDRRVPLYTAISAQEYLKSHSTHQSIPCTMLRKTAIVQAFRESGLCGQGVYDVAELGSGSTREPIYQPATLAAQPAAVSIEREYDTHEPDAGVCPPDMLARILAILATMPGARESYQWRKALADLGVSREADLSEMDARTLLNKLESLQPNADLEPEAAAQWAAQVNLSNGPASAAQAAAEAAPVVTP